MGYAWLQVGAAVAFLAAVASARRGRGKYKLTLRALVVMVVSASLFAYFSEGGGVLRTIGILAAMGSAAYLAAVILVLWMAKKLVELAHRKGWHSDGQRFGKPVGSGATRKARRQ
jgi:hypothetical protein